MGNLLIHGLFEESCRKYADEPAVLLRKPSGWERLTYAQLREKSLRIAGFLASRGIGKGAKCCLFLENGPDWPAAYLGMCYAGVTCVPIDVQTGRQEIAGIAAHSEASLIFCSRETRSRIPGLPLEAVLVETASASPPARDLPEIAEDDIASLLYTSGTTGRPKGVLLSHRNFCSDALGILRSGLGGRNDNILSILPLYHSYPFTVTMLLPLIAGGRITYSALGLKPEDIAEVVRTAGVTIFVGVPELYALMHRQVRARIKVPPFLLRPAFLLARPRLRRMFGPSLRIFASGGARLDPVVGRELSEMFGVKMLEGYGLTETAPVDTFNPPEKVKFGSVGVPIPGVEVRIAGGSEVAIKGPNVMAGYYRDPEATKEAVRDGWFYSGDLGRMDADGYLYIIGRKKEMIVLSSGKKVFPEELEERYARGRYIKEIFIYPKEEEQNGVPTQTIHAVVVPDLAYFRKKNESNIREKIRWELQDAAVSLPPHQRIMGFTISHRELPMTALHKIRRQEAMEKFVAGPGQPLPQETEKPLSPEDKRLLESPEAQKIMGGLTRLTNKKAALYSNLELDLGLDSLARVQLELELEKAFSRRIPERTFAGAYTVKDVIERMVRLDRAQGTQPIRPAAEKAGWKELLSGAPSPEMLAAVRTEPTLTDKFLTGFFLLFFRGLYKLLWFLKSGSASRIPEGPCLICANHASYLDGLAVFCSLPFKTLLRTYFVGFEKIFELPVIRLAIKPGRLIPINPDTSSVDSLRMITYLLNKGKMICVFPEGQRSGDGIIHGFKSGVGIVAKETGVACLPVHIAGSYRAWPRQKRLPRLFVPITVDFGRPLSGSELLERAREKGGDVYQAVAQTLREAVIRTGEKSS
ncbi:MAG: AMP-binding protein [Deltaproteobacteria bacterium]